MPRDLSIADEPVATGPRDLGISIGDDQPPVQQGSGDPAEQAESGLNQDGGAASMAAFRAMHAGIGPDAAHGALALARKTGVAPEFVADNLDDVKQRAEHDNLATSLAGMPTTAAWMNRSHVHAAAAKEDVKPLGTLEKLLSPVLDFGAGLVRGVEDIGQQEFATAQMSAPTEFGEDALQTQDDEGAEFAQQHPGMAADVGRSAPSLALYFLTQKLGESVAGPAGGAAATGAMMFGLNRGSLYRQIMQQQPMMPVDDADTERLQKLYGAPKNDTDFYDYDAYEKRARTYATVGAGVSAALGAGLSSALSLALPGVAQRVQSLSNGLVARAFTDPATRDIVGRLVDIGGHTLWGALMMAVPAVSDDATVQKAVSGEIDKGHAAGAGWEAFKKSLLAAGVLSAIPHAKPLVEDIGRIRRAPVDAQRLDAMVDSANDSKLIKDAPREVEPLIAKMAANGDASTVYVAPEATEDLRIAQKLVDALGDDGRAVAAAQEAGHDVAVPVEKYLTTLADAHDELREDVKLSPDGLTPREAEALRRELDGWEQHATADNGADTVESRPLPELAAQKYGGTASDWESILTPESVQRVRGAIGGTRPSDRTATPEAIPLSESAAAKQERTAAGRILVTVDAKKLAELAEARINELGQGPTLAWDKDRTEQAASFDKLTAAPHVYVGSGANGPAVEVADGRHRIAEAAKRGGALKVQVSHNDANKLRSLLPTENVAETIWQGRSPEDWAKETIDAAAIGEIHPGRYELAARRAEDKLAAIAKEAAERGVQAARTGFLAAGMQGLEAAPEDAGKANLKKAGKTAEAADRRLTKIPMLERARDLARAEAHRAAEVRDEMDRAKAYLDSRDAPEYRGQLNLAGPEYLNAFDAIMDGIDDTMAGSAPNTAAVDALLAKMARDAQPIGFDEQALRDVLGGNRGWSKLTPPEARNVLDAVKNIRHAAHEVQAITVDDRRVGLREVVESIADETAAKKDIQPLKYSSGNEPPFLTAVRMRLNDANAKMLQFKTNVEDLGPTAKSVLYDRMNERVYYRDELARKVGDFYRENFDKMPKEIRSRAHEEMDLSADLPMPKGVAPLTSVRRTYLYLLRLNDGSAGNMDRVLGGMGWTREAVDRVLYENPKTRLSREELDFLQSMHALNDQEMWPLAKAKQERLTGIAPPKVAGETRTVYFEDGTSKAYEGGYWPLREDRGISAPRVMATPGPGGIADFYGDNYQRAGLYNSTMKERAATAQYPVDMDWSVVPSHIAQVVHDLAMDEYVRDAGKLLVNPEFKALAERKLGQGRADELALQLRRIATRRADSVAAEAGFPYKAMQYVRGAAIMAVMGDARMAVAQFSHIPGMLIGGRVSARHGLPALLTMFKPLGIDADGTHFLPNWKAAYDASGELRHRDINSTKRITEDVANLTKATKPLEIVRTIAAVGMHLVDRYTSTWAWTASHNEGLAKGMDPEAAVKYADGVVQDIMPTHDIERAAPLLTNRTIGALLMMHGFGSTLYQMGYRSVIRPVSDSWSAGQRAKAIGIGAFRGAQFMAMNAVLGAVWHTLAHGRDADESWDAMLERTAIGGQFTMFPWLGSVGELAGAAVTKATNDGAAQHLPTVSARSAPGLYLVQRGYDVLGKLASENREPDQKFFDVLEAALAAARVPPQYSRAARYTYDVLQGEQTPRGPLDAVGAVYRGGNYSREPREHDIFTAMQDVVSGD